MAFPADDLTWRVMSFVEQIPGKWGESTGFDLPVIRAQSPAPLERVVGDEVGLIEDEQVLALVFEQDRGDVLGGLG